MSAHVMPQGIQMQQQACKEAFFVRVAYRPDMCIKCHSTACLLFLIYFTQTRSPLYTTYFLCILKRRVHQSWLVIMGDHTACKNNPSESADRLGSWQWNRKAIIPSCHIQPVRPFCPIHISLILHGNNTISLLEGTIQKSNLQRRSPFYRSPCQLIKLILLVVSFLCCWH